MQPLANNHQEHLVEYHWALVMSKQTILNDDQIDGKD
jgi:hypothetical protein